MTIFLRLHLLLVRNVVRVRDIVLVIAATVFKIIQDLIVRRGGDNYLLPALRRIRLRRLVYVEHAYGIGISNAYFQSAFDILELHLWRYRVVLAHRLGRLYGRVTHFFAVQVTILHIRRL